MSLFSLLWLGFVLKRYRACWKTQAKLGLGNNDCWNNLPVGERDSFATCGP